MLTPNSISSSVFILGTEVGEIFIKLQRDRFRFGQSHKLGRTESDLVRIVIEQQDVVRAVRVLALIIKADVYFWHREHSNDVGDLAVRDFWIVHSSVVRDQCLRAAFGSQAK